MIESHEESLWADLCRIAMERPALLIAFNRPDLSRRQLDALREYGATNLYVAIDGPRPGRNDEVKIAAVMELFESIDWAEVRILRQDTNLGCGRAPFEAISWFFGQVDAGYVLEDDILPTRDFFGFCHTLLDMYADEDRVLSIGGNNYVPREHCGSGPYRFSRFAHVSGWASWRRSWDLYRFDISDWRSSMSRSTLRDASGGSFLEAAHWSYVFDQVAKHGLDAWDAQLEYVALSTGRLTALPNVPLITNLGFGGDSTHTHERPWYVLPDAPIEQPLSRIDVTPDTEADRWESLNVLGSSLRGISRKATRLLKRRIQTARPLRGGVDGPSAD